MTLKEALVMVAQEYERAIHLEYIRDPLAYALYRVWRNVESKREEKLHKN